MPWGALATVVVGAYTNSQSNKAAKNGLDATTKGQQAGIDEQRHEFDITQGNMQPFLDFGKWAIPKQQAYLSGDTSGFMNSADYLGALKGQTMALDRSAAAHGMLGSGGHEGDLADLGSRLAQQYGNSYYDKLTGASNTGYGTANALGGYGQNMATNISNAYANIGNARASSYGQIANNNSQFAAGLGGAFNNWYQNYNYGGG